MQWWPRASYLKVFTASNWPITDTVTPGLKSCCTVHAAVYYTWAKQAVVQHESFMLHMYIHTYCTCVHTFRCTQFHHSGNIFKAFTFHNDLFCSSCNPNSRKHPWSCCKADGLDASMFWHTVKFKSLQLLKSCFWKKITIKLKMSLIS